MYQIFELEDSGLPQQGILPISARKTTTMATDICLKKDSPHCAKGHIFTKVANIFRKVVKSLKLYPNSRRIFKNAEYSQTRDSRKNVLRTSLNQRPKNWF